MPLDKIVRDVAPRTAPSPANEGLLIRFRKAVGNFLGKNSAGTPTLEGLGHDFLAACIQVGGSPDGETLAASLRDDSGLRELFSLEHAEVYARAPIDGGRNVAEARVFDLSEVLKYAPFLGNAAIQRLAQDHPNAALMVCRTWKPEDNMDASGAALELGNKSIRELVMLTRGFPFPGLVMDKAGLKTYLDGLRRLETPEAHVA